MGARVKIALLLAGLVSGCDKTKMSAVDDGDGGGATGTAGMGGPGAGGNGGATGDAGTAGRTTVDAAPIDAACMPVELPVSGVHPDILVVLDASGSMDNDVEEANCDFGCGMMSKWALTTAAIKQVVSATGANVSWGLKFFADQDQRCTVSPGVSVPIGQGNAAAISTAIAGRTSENGGVANGGATPTRAAESAAVAYLSTVADGNPKFILLATDGQPNCPATGDVADDDSAPAIQAVTEAYGAGVPTFVVGIGTLTSTEVVLDALAKAGGHPREATPAYYHASSTAELVATFNELVEIARSCRFTVAAPPGTSRDAIDVLLNGTVLPRDTTHAGGWDYADPTHAGIVLFGAACASVKAGATTGVTISYRCPPPG